MYGRGRRSEPRSRVNGIRFGALHFCRDPLDVLLALGVEIRELARQVGRTTLYVVDADLALRAPQAVERLEGRAMRDRRRAFGCMPRAQRPDDFLATRSAILYPLHGAV